MVSKSLVALVAGLATVWAQSTEEPTATAEEAPSGTSSAAEKTHTINVGAVRSKTTHKRYGMDADMK